MEENRVVVVNGSEYKELLQKSQMLDMLFRAIYVGAALNWNGKSLSFDKGRLVEFLEVADHERFTAVYEKLKAEKAEKEAENAAV